MKEISEIYSQMLSVFTEKTGFAMEDSADLAVRLYAAAAQLQTLYVYADWALRQAFVQTAAEEYLDRHAELRGITRKGGTAANGVLRFRTELPLQEDLPIAAGTVCSTAGLVRFVTTEDTVIEAGSLYADASARAESIGTAGNVQAGSITVLTRAPVGVTGVSNPAAFSGGSDGEDDESLRARVLDSFVRLPNGANAAFYELRALSHAGVAAASVIPRENGIGTVGVVIASADGVPDESLVEEVAADLQSVREIAVDVSVRAPVTRTVNISVQLKPKPAVGFDAASVAVRSALEGFFTGRLLGKSVYRVELSRCIYDTGVAENFSILSPAADLEATPDVLPQLGTLTITEATA